MHSFPECRQDGHGDSALLIACHHGHSDVARILLDQGASINYENQVMLIIIVIFWFICITARRKGDLLCSMHVVKIK